MGLIKSQVRGHVHDYPFISDQLQNDFFARNSPDCAKYTDVASIKRLLHSLISVYVSAFDVVALLIGRRTCDLQVAGSSPA